VQEVNSDDMFMVHGVGPNEHQKINTKHARKITAWNWWQRTC